MTATEYLYDAKMVSKERFIFWHQFGGVGVFNGHLSFLVRMSHVSILRGGHLQYIYTY